MTEMTAKEFKQMLELCGYKQSEFTDAFKHSKGFIQSSLSRHKIVPPRYIDELKEFLGKDNFEYAKRKLGKLDFGQISRY